MTLTFKEIKDEIEKLVPKNVKYSIDLEAGNIALITSDFEAFGGGDGLIGKIAKTVKRKIVIRPPLEEIKSQDEALDIIKEILPDEAGLGVVYFV
jgi:predicted metal-dependent RNase